jgi:mevalonate kinase
MSIDTSSSSSGPGVTDGIFDPFVASAPGKIILAGEHAVVHGTHALATVLDRRTFVEFSPLVKTGDNSTCESMVEFLVEAQDTYTNVSWSVSELSKLMPIVEANNLSPSTPSPAPIDLSTAITKLPGASNTPSVIFVYFYLIFVRCRIPLRLTVRTELPIGAGLGSSASFSSAMATGFYAMFHMLEGKTIHDTIELHRYQEDVVLASSPSSSSTTTDVANDNGNTTAQVAPLKRSLSDRSRMLSRIVSRVGPQSAEMPDGSDLPFSGAQFGHFSMADGKHNGIDEHEEHEAHDASGAGAGVDSKHIQVPPHAVKHIINEWAFEGERVIHGNPSGVDNTISVHGAAIMYKKGSDIQFIHHFPPVRLVICNTRVPRNTKKLVAGVGARLKQFPAIVRPIIDAIEEITHELQSLVEIMGNASPQSNDIPKQAWDHFFEDAGVSQLCVCVARFMSSSVSCHVTSCRVVF